MNNWKDRISKRFSIRRSTLDGLTWDLRLAMVRFKNRWVPSRRKRLASLQDRSEIDLHFGSGPQVIPGWVNVDAFAYPGLDAELDLRHPLPLASGSCRFIFSEHTLEHFTVNEASRICEEYFRLLRKGGVCRIVVPDAGRYWRAYQERDEQWFSTVGAEYTVPLEVVNEIYYGHYHQWMYDYELLRETLRKAGFSNIQHSAHLASSHSELRLERDEAFRRESSLYVEAEKD